MRKSRKSQDARQSERINHQLLVYIEEKDDYFVTRNLSENGCLILMEEPLPKGSEINLVFSLPGDKTLRVKGIVKHSGKGNDSIGVEFVDMGLFKKLYMSFLKSLSALKDGKAFYDVIKETTLPNKKQKFRKTAQKAISTFTVMKTVLIVLVLVSLFLGVAKQHLLEKDRKDVAKQMAATRGSVVITMVHRQETVGLLGIPVKQYIKVEDAESILRAIRSVPDGKPIDMIIHTPGGILFSAYQIAKALKEHKGKVTVFVPHYAMSGGTLIALGADKIVMDKDAIIGPVDPQLVQGKNAMPAVALAEIPKFKKWDKIDDSTVVLIDQAKKSLQQLRNMVKSLLADRTNPEALKRILKRLVGGHVTHDYPIFPDEAKQIGLPVSTGMPREVYHLMALYPQPSRPSITRTN